MVARGLRQDQKPRAMPAPITGMPMKRRAPMGSFGTFCRRSKETRAEGRVRSQRREESRRGRVRGASIEIGVYGRQEEGARGSRDEERREEGLFWRGGETSRVPPRVLREAQHQAGPHA